MPNRALKQTAEPSGVPKRLDPNARKAQLLVHAMSAFADAGIERAVHADVAIRAKVSTPTVFKYFPTREALVDAVLTEVEDTILDLARQIPSDIVLTPFEMTRTIFRIVSDICIAKPDLMKVALSWSVAFSSVRERYKLYEADKLNALQTILETASDDSRTDAKILFASLLLYVRMHFDDTSEESRDHYVERLCKLVATLAP